MNDNSLDLAILGVQDELDAYEANSYGCSYDDGYKQALRDTIENLKLLKRSLGL